MMDFDSLEKQFGTVDYKNIILYLTERAETTHCGADGGIEYCAVAVDKQGNSYKVTWNTTKAWDDVVELSKLHSAHDEAERHDDEIYGKDLERFKVLLAMDNLPDINDTTNACNWDRPTDIQLI